MPLGDRVPAERLVNGSAGHHLVPASQFVELRRGPRYLVIPRMPAPSVRMRECRMHILARISAGYPQVPTPEPFLRKELARSAVSRHSRTMKLARIAVAHWR